MSYQQQIQFQAGAVVTLRWPDFQALITTKNLLVQYITNTDSYTVFAFDGPVAYTCLLIQAAYSSNFPFASDYSQAQNDTDTATFLATYQPTANSAVEQRATDGRAVIRNTYASKTKCFNLKVFSFIPGQNTSVVNKDTDFTDMTDVTVTCYDASGAVTSDPTVAVKTTVDWEPHYNYEVIGGFLDIPSSISGTTPGVWYVMAIGVPDIPRAYGGSASFVSPVDMALIMGQRVISDGRATQYLTYNPTYHTNKLRWIYIHPASSSNPRIQMYVEVFV